MEMSPQIKNQLNQFQQIQQQMQALGTQLYQLEMQTREIEKTLEELEKLPDSAVLYKNIGSLMARADDKDGVKVELEEKKETTDVRIKTLKKQEQSLRERYQGLQEQLSKALQEEPETPGAG